MLTPCIHATPGSRHDFLFERPSQRRSLQANTVTKKNSLARNLHRLRTAVHFIMRIMSLLAKDREMALSSAVAEAYQDTLGPYHSTVVRGTCQAGFLLLPTRATFLSSIGETGTQSMVICLRAPSGCELVCCRCRCMLRPSEIAT